MANISVNNGISTTTVEALDEAQVRAIVHGGLAVAFDQEVIDSLDAADNDREWLELYCAAHQAKHGAALIIG